MTAPPTGAAGATASAEEAAANSHAIQRRGTRQLLMARAVFMVFGYVISVVLARELEPAGFGVYGILLATLVWLEMVAYSGVPAALGKLIPDHADRVADVEQAGRFVLFCSSVVLFAIGWLAAPTVAQLFHLPGGARLFRLAILDLPVAAAYQGYSGLLMGTRRFGLLGASQVVLATGKFLAVLSLMVLGFSVEHALLANVAGSLAALLFLLVRLPPSGVRLDRDMVARLVRVAIPMGLFAVALQVLVSLDLWFLGSMEHGDTAVVGRYVASLKIAQTLIVIPIVQSGVVLASVAWALAAGDRPGARRHLLEGTRFALILAAPACVIVGGSAGSLLSFIYDSKYAGGAPFLVIQLIAFSCFGLLDTFAHALMAAGRQRVTATVLVSFIPVVAIANLILIPAIGPVGAAVALLIGMVGIAVVNGLMVWRYLGPPFALATVARVAAASLLVGIPAVLVPVSGPLVLLKIGLLGAAYLLILKLLGEISAADFALPKVETAPESAS